MWIRDDGVPPGIPLWPKIVAISLVRLTVPMLIGPATAEKGARLHAPLYRPDDDDAVDSISREKEERRVNQDQGRWLTEKAGLPVRVAHFM